MDRTIPVGNAARLPPPTTQAGLWYKAYLSWERGPKFAREGIRDGVRG